MRRVLTVQFDVTGLDDDAIDTLEANASLQATEFEIYRDGEPSDQWASARFIGSSVEGSKEQMHVSANECNMPNCTFYHEK